MEDLIGLNGIFSEIKHSHKIGSWKDFTFSNACQRNLSSVGHMQGLKNIESVGSSAPRKVDICQEVRPKILAYFRMVDSIVEVICIKS